MAKLNDLNKKRSNGWFITIAITILLVIIIFSVFESVIVVGDSMLPNYEGGTIENTKAGDKVIISKIYGLDYGDVVVFYSNKLQSNLIKRVVGLEGDTIEIKAGKLFRNGELIEENYIKEPMRVNNNYRWTLGKGEVLVLGDNRNNSEDSRHFGAINKKDIRGEVIIRISAKGGKLMFI